MPKELNAEEFVKELNKLKFTPESTGIILSKETTDLADKVVVEAMSTKRISVEIGKQFINRLATDLSATPNSLFQQTAEDVSDVAFYYLTTVFNIEAKSETDEAKAAREKKSRYVEFAKDVYQTALQMSAIRCGYK